MTIVVGAALLVIVFLLFLGYSMLSRSHSKEMQENYKKFKDAYGKKYHVGFGMHQDSVFSNSYQVMIATDDDHVIVDAVINEGNSFEVETRQATEFLGMNVQKYMREQEREFKGNYYATQRSKLSGKEKALIGAIKIVER